MNLLLVTKLLKIAQNWMTIKKNLIEIFDLEKKMKEKKQNLTALSKYQDSQFSNLPFLYQLQHKNILFLLKVMKDRCLNRKF